MKLQRKIVFIIFSVFLNIPAIPAPGQFKTDISQLSPRQQELYSYAENIINNWPGEKEKLSTAEAIIESFIASTPEFLPMHIEKARLTIIKGASGKNDYLRANRAALQIIANIQKKDPAYAKSYVLAGHVYINLGDFDSAKKSLEHAERIGTADPWLYYNWADLSARGKQYDVALAYARKALVLSKDNGEALVSAIAFISNYAKYSEHLPKSDDISVIVFESIKEPEQRMRIATRLTDGYQGDATILERAYEIIDKQNQETPHLEAVDLAMAEWLLKKGYLNSLNYVPRYERRYSSAAEMILDQIKPTKSANTRIFSNKFSIALGNNDLKKAELLLAEAESGDVSRDKIMAGKALMMWVKGDYVAVTKILESVAEHNPDVSDDQLLMAAYARLGRTDLLDAHYRRAVDRYPTNAWALGNYAFFLLFDVDDIDGAINYGDKALMQMTYPLAQNTTALAYLMKASMLQRSGDLVSAKTTANRALSIGFDEEFVFRYCKKYCADIRIILALVTMDARVKNPEN